MTRKISNRRWLLLATLAACFFAAASAVAVGDEPVPGAEPAATPPDDATATTPRAAPQPGAAQDLVPPTPPNPSSDYGDSAASGGGVAVIGAPHDDGGGSASVFTVGPDGSYSYKGTVGPVSGESGFGAAVATDGDTIAVGGPGGGEDSDPEAVSLFDPDTLAVIRRILGADAGLSGPSAGFGSAVAVSGDWLAIAAPGANTVFLYYRDQGNWGGDPYQSLLGQADSSFGYALAMDGTRLVVGAPFEVNPPNDLDPYGYAAGAAHLYELLTGGDGEHGDWVENRTLYDPEYFADEHFGRAVDISGDTVVVGGPGVFDGNGGHALVFTDAFGAGGRAPSQVFTAPSEGDGGYGKSVAIDGNDLAIGYSHSDFSGAVDLFQLDPDTRASGDSFTKTGTLHGTGPGDGYGNSLALSNGNLIAGGGGHASAARVRPADPTVPTEPQDDPGPKKFKNGGSHEGGGESGGGSGGHGGGHGAAGPGEVLVVPSPLPGKKHRAAHEGGEGGEGEGAGHSEEAGAHGEGAEAHGEEHPVDRSSFAERVLSPARLDLSFTNLAEGGLLAFLLAALLYLPVMIFNKATERNHHTIHGWFAGPRKRLAAFIAWFPFREHPLAVLLATGVVGGCLFAFVEPHFPGESGWVQYLLGMIIGFMLVATVFFMTWRGVIRRLEPEGEGDWVLFPPYILLAVVLVALARFAHFLPGVVLGTLAEYEPGKKLSVRTAGMRVLVTYGVLLVLGCIAWFAWIPVEHAAKEEGASSLTLILDSALAVTFVTSLESVVFGLIPLRFLDGEELFTWSKKLWLLLWGIGLYWFAMVILHPALTTYNEVSGSGAVVFGLMFSSLLIVALATWAFFKVRELRTAPPAEEGSGS